MMGVKQGTAAVGPKLPLRSGGRSLRQSSIL